MTDYLLDNLEDDEVDAVVAHEFGHLRGRHVLIKLLAVVAVWAILQTLLVFARGSSGHGGTTLLVAPLLIAFPIGIVLVNGLLGVRLEERADDRAARQVGGAVLAAALAEVGRLNDTKRNTGRTWSLLTQHPGLDRRLARLRNDTRPAGTAGAGADTEGAG